MLGYTSDSHFLSSLENGEIKVVEIDTSSKGGDIVWKVNEDVKKRILEVFKKSEVVNMEGYCDKAPLKPRSFDISHKIRVVPGGTAIRAGAYIAKNVVVMPPSYINIGAYVDEGTMVDSHVLVGSCARIGRNVHLSAGVTIGGVLEPVNNKPVIIEDDCFIGAGSTITESIVIRERAIIAQGVSLSASIPIYDVVNSRVYKGEIPREAVVVSGSRSIGHKNEWARDNGLSINCAIIVKYRDQKTDASVILETLLRENAVS